MRGSELLPLLLALPLVALGRVPAAKAELASRARSSHRVGPVERALSGGLVTLRGPGSTMIRVVASTFVMGSTPDEILEASASCSHEPLGYRCNEHTFANELPGEPWSCLRSFSTAPRSRRGLRSLRARGSCPAAQARGRGAPLRRLRAARDVRQRARRRALLPEPARALASRERARARRTWDRRGAATRGAISTPRRTRTTGGSASTAATRATATPSSPPSARLRQAARPTASSICWEQPPKWTADAYTERHDVPPDLRGAVRRVIRVVHYESAPPGSAAPHVPRSRPTRTDPTSGFAALARPHGPEAAPGRRRGRPFTRPP
jgi:hypothetical protein